MLLLIENIILYLIDLIILMCKNDKLNYIMSYYYKF